MQQSYLSHTKPYIKEYIKNKKNTNTTRNFRFTYSLLVIVGKFRKLLMDLFRKEKFIVNHLEILFIKKIHK